MKFSSLESSNRGELNGGKIRTLGSVDNEIRLFKNLENFNINLTSIDPRDMILPPFDSPRLGDSNELNFIFLGSVDAEIFRQNVFLQWSEFTIKNLVMTKYLSIYRT